MDDFEGVRGRGEAVYSSFFSSAAPSLMDLTKSSYTRVQRQRCQRSRFVSDS